MPIPDYAGFRQWLAAQHRVDPSFGLVFNRFSPHVTGAESPGVQLYQEMCALEQRYGRDLQSVKGSATAEYRMTFHKLKLLTSALRGDVRSAEVARALSQTVDLRGDLGDGLAACTQAELRVRLFASLSRKHWRTAFKIIGKLKDESHDPGELAYLEALAMFHSDDLDGCIRYAARVSSTHADFPAASALWLESLAYRGEPRELIERIEAIGSTSLTPMFFRYLVQVLILNSGDPEEAAGMLATTGERSSWQLSEIAARDDPYSPAFNRHSCSVALRLAEFSAAASIARDLSHADDVVDNDAIETDLARLLLPLLTVDPDLAEAIKTAEHEHRYGPIVARLMNAPYETGLDDLTQALGAQLRLGAADVFIENISTLVTQLGDQEWPTTIFDLVQTAYIEAASRGHLYTQKLYEALRSASAEGDGTSRYGAQIQRNQRLVFLSPMGRLAYAWAENALAVAESSSAWHGDAGMISLGFFRILEHELNELLIGPLRMSEAARLDVQALWDRLSPVLTAPDDSVAQKAMKNRLRAHELWTDMIKRLQSVFLGERTGLELGPLGMLIDKSRSKTGDDTEIKRYFADKLTSRLTEQGKTAFFAGEISGFVERSTIERFRNPPAHSRFVSLASAADCKRHVDSALLSLSQWSMPHARPDAAHGTSGLEDADVATPTDRD